MGGTIILEVSEAGFVGEWRKKKWTDYKVTSSDVGHEIGKQQAVVITNSLDSLQRDKQ